MLIANKEIGSVVKKQKLMPTFEHLLALVSFYIIKE